MLFCAMVYKTKQDDKNRKFHVANTQAQGRQQANKILKGNGSREFGVKEENAIKTVHQSNLVRGRGYTRVTSLQPAHRPTVSWTIPVG